MFITIRSRVSANQTKVMQRRIVLFAVYGVIITCIISVIFLSVPYYLDLKKYVKRELLLRSSIKALSVEQLLYRFEQQAKSISGRIHARHLLGQYVRGERNKKQVKTHSEKILIEAVRQAPDIVGVIRVSHNKEILLRVGEDFEETISRVGYILNNINRASFGKIVTPKNGENLLIYYSPILNHKGLVLGLDIIALRVDKLRNILEPEKIHSTVLRTAFYSESGVIHNNMSSTNTGFSNEDDQYTQPMAASLSSGSNKKVILSSKNTEYIYALAKVKNSKWLIASKVNRAELYRPFINRVLVLLAISALITGIGVLVMRRIMRPLSSQVVEPAERSRLESEAKYHALFESAGDAIILMHEGRTVDCNQKTLHLFRCKRDEFIGKTPKDFSPEIQPDGLDSHEKALKLISNAHKGEAQYFEWLCLCPDKYQFPAEVSLTRIEVRDSYLIQVIVRDISERKRTEETIYHMAYHDALTGLVNRNEFEKRLLHTIKSVKDRGSDNAMLYIDLDQFKAVNDSCGHAAGDNLLKDIAKLLLNPVRERDTVARLGGDEFGILLENCTPASAMEIATEMVKMIGEFRFHWEDKTFSVGASVGISLINTTRQTIDEIMKTADMACYTAKKQGRNRVHMFTPDDEDF